MANVTSSIKLKRATGSITDEPGGLAEGELAINLLNGKLFYGTRFGFGVSSSFTVDRFTASFVSISNNLTAQNLTVTNTASITYLETVFKTASVIFTSGSTIFGNTSDDTHQRTGSMFISGGLTMGSTSPITASTINASNITASNITASLITASTISSSFISASVISASEYFGVTKTQYQTGSTAQEDLLNLKILNFDNEVFVTSDPVTGQLTLQFGEASLPTVALQFVGGTFPQVASNGSTTLVSTDYIDNRFNHQSQSSFVFTASISNVPDTITILSASLSVDGTEVRPFQLTYRSSSDPGLQNARSLIYEVTAPNAIIGTSMDGTDSGNAAGANGFIKIRENTGAVGTRTTTTPDVFLNSGSGQSITSSWTVIDGTGTIQTVTASYVLTQSKSNPTQNIVPTPNFSGLQGGSEFVSSSNNTRFIESGITGAISYTTTSMDDYSNLWVLTGTEANKTNPFNIEVTQSTITLTATANYTSIGSPGSSSLVGGNIFNDKNQFATISSGSESPNSTPTKTGTKTFKNVTSIRHFASPSASFTEDKLWDIKGEWTSSVFSASIKFGSTPNPNGVSFNQPIPAESAYPAGLFVWIIYSASFGDITGLTQNGSPALGNFSKVHDYGTYKAYRSNTVQSSDPGSTYVITI
tara:strand:+ start:825 stop:2759 length:1935 start_codon:yes stop_codon:yes gene_type:complete